MCRDNNILRRLRQIEINDNIFYFLQLSGFEKKKFIQIDKTTIACCVDIDSTSNLISLDLVKLKYFLKVAYFY